MRNIILATATGLVLAVSFIGGWATSTSQARVAALAGDPVDPLQIMTNAKNLPHEEFVDYTTFFPARH